MRAIRSNLKNNIALALLVFLTATCCVSFSAAVDAVSFGGSISKADFSSIDHSMIALAHTGLREGDSRNEGHEENLAKTIPVSDHFSRVFRKLMLIFGCGSLSDSSVQLGHYYQTICIASCAYLFYLTIVRIIHRKDGAK